MVRYASRIGRMQRWKAGLGEGFYWPLFLIGRHRHGFYDSGDPFPCCMACYPAESDFSDLASPHSLLETRLQAGCPVLVGEKECNGILSEESALVSLTRHRQCMRLSTNRLFVVMDQGNRAIGDLTY